MKRLFTFRGFAHDPQGVLAAIQRLALVLPKALYDLVFGEYRVFIARQERTIAVFADARHRVAEFHDPQIALGHDKSLRPLATASLVAVQSKRHPYRTNQMRRAVPAFTYTARFRS
jgi:hypothetical protein